jgi:hypothetical protein
MGGVMRRRQIGVVGGIKDVAQTRVMAPKLGCLVRGSHGGKQGGELAHHTVTLVGVLLVGMNCLGMLAQIVETRELLSTMTSERTFSSVLPV